ncbi:hypothetical protein [Spirosoma validum]|uniref:Uncharacterized protein n=1 Tax=Spirosoma validum TaxID=2771355 RepID=A0A927AX08_9BACT|nr:hypothetical protein [Spirosoma validum]MBD2751310.1 hypothetical protein [Spirosoma validum]
MNNKLLGLFALIGAPFLCINTYIHVPDPNAHVYITDSLSGFLDLLYISGWLCSMIGLRRIGAMGTDRFGRISTIAILGSLTLANLWNIYEMILPNHNTLLYYVLDSFWPISNVVMIGVGIAVIRARKLTGWKRYVPILCGLWLPITILISFTVGDMAFAISNGYTIIAWTLLAIIVLTSKVPADEDEYMAGLEIRVL